MSEVKTKSYKDVAISVFRTKFHLSFKGKDHKNSIKNKGRSLISVIENWSCQQGIHCENHQSEDDKARQYH